MDNLLVLPAMYVAAGVVVSYVNDETKRQDIVAAILWPVVVARWLKDTVSYYLG